jgi:hypothetical protein
MNGGGPPMINAKPLIDDKQTIIPIPYRSVRGILAFIRAPGDMRGRNPRTVRSCP